jgi:hypothetical protein
MRTYSAFFILRLATNTALAVSAVAAPALADDLGKLLSDNQNVSEDILAGQRGGMSSGGQVAVVKDNFAVTGVNNSLNEVANSMNGASGLFNVIQNSGSNVAIQSQITVNANLQ